MTGSDAPATGLRSDETALEQVLALLGSPGSGERRHEHRWAVLPTCRSPRYLVPLGSRRVAAATRLRTSRSRVGRFAGTAVGGLVRSGGARLHPFQAAVAVDRSIVELLRTRLDRPQLEVAVALGRPRVNRKPVLQLIDGDGTTVGFGKVGVDEHTDELVRREGRFLAEAGGVRPPLVLPEALLAESWRGHELLVVSDLGAGLDGTGVLEVTAEAISAIAALGPTSTAPVLDSEWWRRIEQRIADLPESTGPLLQRCRDHALEMLNSLEATDWRFGQWHGDLARWNAAVRDGSLVVWDWERSTGPVPVGLDAVHAHYQPPLLADGRSGPECAYLAMAGAGPVLAALGHAGREHAIVAAYLLELRVRLAEDETKGSLGDGQWFADAFTEAALGWKP